MSPPGLRGIGLSVLLILAGLALALAFGWPAVAQAASAPLPDTGCSQSALQSALSAGQSTITFAPGCTIKLTSSLTVGSGVDVTIDGNGVVLDGGSGRFGIINVNDSASSPSTLELDDVTIEGGDNGIWDDSKAATVKLVGSKIRGNHLRSIQARSAAVADSTIDDSSEIEVGADVTVNNSSVGGITAGASVSTSNSSIGGISAGTSATVTNSSLGGIAAGTTVTVAGSTVTGGGGIAVFSLGANGGNSPTGSAVVTNSTFGGCVYVHGGFFNVSSISARSVTFIDSKITGCNGPAVAGGINAASSATVTGSTLKDSGVYAGNTAIVKNSSIASAISSGQADGVSAPTVTLTNSAVSGSQGWGILAGNKATVTNSTVSGNLGGGILVGSIANNGSYATASSAVVTDSTISGNGKNAGNGIAANDVSLISSTVTGNSYNGILANGTASMTASLLADNKTNCVATTLTDLGYNLSTDDSCHFSATGSKNNVSLSALHLLPLASNGGPTQTMALSPGSIAINAIPAVNGQCAVGNSTDQRGVSRPQGTGCDIGAFEATSNTPNSVYFPETGHFLSNGFLAFWQHFGGLAVFGYPISDEFQQNGVTVQYFERARFEWHPGSHPSRYDVELGLLGDQAAVTARQQDPAPFVPIQAASDANCTFYAPTGHRLCFGFRAFWQSHGGLPNFGYPISEEFTQKGLTVQYFERAVFEYHPNNPVAYQVELRLLGDEFVGSQH